MKVTVIFFGPLRDFVGKREVEVEVDEKATVQDLLDELCRNYGSRFTEYVLRTGFPRLILDGKSIQSMSYSELRLKDGSRFCIFPPAVGG